MVDRLYLNLIKLGNDLLPMKKAELSDPITVKCLNQSRWLLRRRRLGNLRLSLRLLGRMDGHVDEGAQEQTVRDHQWIEIYLQG